MPHMVAAGEGRTIPLDNLQTFRYTVFMYYVYMYVYACIYVSAEDSC